MPFALPVLHRQVDADMARDGGQVDRCVGRAADRRVDLDRVVWNASLVRMSEGFRSSLTISTMRLP